MYLVFCGTTDYLSNLKAFLENVNHTLLEGTSSWNGSSLKAQIVLCFERNDAELVQKFMLEKCNQKEVPIKYLVSI